MLKSRPSRIGLSSLIVFVAFGLLGNSGLSYAADRTVIGELWSADG